VSRALFVPHKNMFYAVFVIEQTVVKRHYRAAQIPENSVNSLFNKASQQGIAA
jgi:hypothetical protein